MMLRHRIEVIDYGKHQVSDALNQILDEQREALSAESAAKRQELLDEIQKILSVQEDTSPDLEATQAPNAKSPVQEQQRFTQISIEGAGNFFVPLTPEIDERLKALDKARQARASFRALNNLQIEAEAAISLLSAMGDDGWILADMLRRLYPNFYTDLYIFVKSDTPAVESDTSVESNTSWDHTQVPLEELNAIEEDIWEEGNKHIETLQDVSGITDMQIEDARVAQNTSIPVEALTKIGKGRYAERLWIK